MSRVLFLTCLLLAAVLTAAPAAANLPGPPLAASGSLENLRQEKEPATLDAGGGLTMKLTGGGNFQENLLLADRGRQVQDLEGGKFLDYARLEQGPATYWVISEFTGGAHCCARYHVLARPVASQAVRYLGATGGDNGGPQPLEKSFIIRQGQLYLKRFDNRFDYFHASHADSLLVNVPPVFYRLTPHSLTLDNAPFKDVYLKEARRVEEEIRQQQAQRRGKLQAILGPGPVPTHEFLQFTDPLGQLLVRRTILYLAAGEEQSAWESLARDVRRYYQSDKYLPELRREIAANIKTDEQ